MLRRAELLAILHDPSVIEGKLRCRLYSPRQLLDVDLQSGKPPILLAEATGDAPGWAAEHRDALRAVVAEHGSVLVRGLDLRDAAGDHCSLSTAVNQPDDREGGLRGPAGLRRRGVFLGDLAGEPADVHAS